MQKEDNPPAVTMIKNNIGCIEMQNKAYQKYCKDKIKNNIGCIEIR